MDDMTRWSGVFLLLSCCWLSRLTVWQIQFGILECIKAISTGPELCVQTEEAAACPHRTDWNAHTNLGRPSIVCGPVFSLLLLPVGFSLSSPCLRKLICFKTRAKYYHIYIFLFQESSTGGVYGVDLFLFQWKGLRPGLGSVWNFKPFSCLFVLWFFRARCLH